VPPIEDAWPLFRLRIRSEQLVLRLPTDDDLVELCAVARAGIHPPQEMPFGLAWTDKPSPRLEHEFAQHHWSLRANWRPDDWTLELGVFLDGRPIGAQGIGAKEFGVLRTVSTGSWIGREFQGHGYGKASRWAILALAFDGLDADAAESAAFVDNAASNAVSRTLGYDENGVFRMAPRGEPRDAIRFRLTREAWVSRARPAVSIDGLEASLELFGGKASGPGR